MIAGNIGGENRFSGLKKLITDPASGDLLATTAFFASNVSGDSLLRIDPETLPLPIAPQTLASALPLEDADEMAFDPVSGDVFVANGVDILRFDSTGGNASVVSEGGFFDRGFQDFTIGLAMDAQGQLLTTLKFGDAVVRVDPETGGQQIASFSNLIRLPQGIVVMPVPEPAAALGAIAALLTIAVVKRVRFDRVLSDGGLDGYPKTT